MPSWKIYLAKTLEVAGLIAALLRNNGVVRVRCGTVDHACRVPEIHHDKGYYFCAIENRGCESWDNPAYELVVA